MLGTSLPTLNIAFNSGKHCYSIVENLQEFLQYFPSSLELVFLKISEMYTASHVCISGSHSFGNFLRWKWVPLDVLVINYATHILCHYHVNVLYYRTKLIKIRNIIYRFCDQIWNSLGRVNENKIPNQNTIVYHVNIKTLPNFKPFYSLHLALPMNTVFYRL